jgi:2-polyprenyl-3-methyl-5-hydroxy-6-metoxy-1,4-benzoquinol methylase
MNYKTWDEFWGEFLQVTFHEGNPELWPARQRKADWIQLHTKLHPGAQILDLGCGDGMIDILLSRMGYHVTAVDRSEVVLKLARKTDDTGKVQFIILDLKHIDFPKASFDAVLIIETSGLMSKAEDFAMLQKAAQWLKPGGKLIMDCPEVVDVTNTWSRDFPQGTITGKSSFDTLTRIQDIQFFFKTLAGEEFGLHDPYDLEKSTGSGITRYLYPKKEVSELFKAAGLAPQEIPHYYPANYFAFMGTK